MDKTITFKEDGVQINGTKILYNAPLQNISREQIDTLATNPFDSWNGFLMFRVLQEIKESVNAHLVCPVNVEGINKLIDRKIENHPKVVWSKAKKWFVGISIVGGAIIVILNILTLLKDIFTKMPLR